MTKEEIEELQLLIEVCELEKGGVFFPDALVMGRYYKLKGKKEEHDNVQEAIELINKIKKGISRFEEVTGESEMTFKNVFFQLDVVLEKLQS